MSEQEQEHEDEKKHASSLVLLSEATALVASDDQSCSSPGHTGAAANRSVSPQRLPYDELCNENRRLKEENRRLEREIANLKQSRQPEASLPALPVGRISQIPVNDMISIMQEYGSEVSSQVYQTRKKRPKDASIVRQFRRWNPDFLTYFLYRNGKWEPKLGKQAELQRREEKRKAMREGKSKEKHLER